MTWRCWKTTRFHSNKRLGFKKHNDLETAILFYHFDPLVSVPQNMQKITCFLWKCRKEKIITFLMFWNCLFWADFEGGTFQQAWKNPMLLVRDHNALVLLNTGLERRIRNRLPMEKRKRIKWMIFIWTPNWIAWNNSVASETTIGNIPT